jgi:hypothetical protein
MLRLQRDNARLAQRLTRAEAIIELQKKWRSCWAARYSRTATGRDRRSPRPGAYERSRHRGVCRAGGVARHRASVASGAGSTAGATTPAPVPGAGVDVATAPGSARSAACATLRRPGARRDLRHPARRRYLSLLHPHHVPRARQKRRNP